MQQYMENCEVSDGANNDKWSYIYAACHMICTRTTYQKEENADISDRILEYIQKNYTDANLSLKVIASDISVSLSAASKAFKNAYGINFYDYTCRLRMEKAKEMLKASNASVKDLCKAVGYENEFSLRRTFLRYEGISISDYKKSLQK
jgi:YesN/AraC family two-component response regulator